MFNIETLNTDLRAKGSLQRKTGAGTLFDWFLGICLILVILLQFPSVPLLIRFGKVAYIKDVLAVFFCGYLLITQFRTLIKSKCFLWLLAAIVLFSLCIAPVIIKSGYLVPVLVTLKWCYLWMFAFVSGVWFSAPSRRRVLMLLIAGMLFYCGVELAIGQWERRAGTYYVQTGAGETTYSGALLTKDQSLERDTLRVRGFQRDVFLYANLMLLAMCIPIVVSNNRSVWIRMVVLPLVLLFAFGALTSGGRSAALGVFAGGFFWLLWLFLPGRRRPVFISAAGFFIILNAAVVVHGVSWLVEPVSKRFSSETALVNDNSSVMRDEAWGYFRTTLLKNPSALIVGFPVSSLLSPSRGISILTTTDNVLYGVFWHCGIVGGALLCFLVFRFLYCYTWWDPRMGGAAVLLFAVVAEAIARDVQYYWTFLGLLFLLGMNLLPAPRITNRRMAQKSTTRSLN